MTSSISQEHPSYALGNIENLIFHFLQKHVFVIRFSIVTCLLSCAIVIGYGFYLIISYQQNMIQQDQYYSIVEKIESSLITSFQAQQHTVSFTSNLALQFCPKDISWSNCTLPHGLLSSFIIPFNQLNILQTISVAALVPSMNISTLTRSQLYHPGKRP